MSDTWDEFSRSHGAEVLRNVRRENERAFTHKPQRTSADYLGSAIAYSRWLAQRDGIAIPQHAYACPVRADGKISAIEWRDSKWSFVTIALPHWDWEPRTERS